MKGVCRCVNMCCKRRGKRRKEQRVRECVCGGIRGIYPADIGPFNKNWGKKMPVSSVLTTTEVVKV